jgi:hypothetical protein
MKTVLISIFSGALMLGVASAQDNTAPAPASPPSNPQTSTPAQPSAPQAATESSGQAMPKRIAPGSVIPVSLTKAIDAKKAKTGDEVVAKVTQDMKTNAGEVLVAKDTKVVGHVTEAQARNKEQKESQVGITFDRAVMKNGSEMELPMSIQAIIGSQNPGSQSSGPQNSESSGGGNSGGVPSSGAGGYPNSQRAGGMTGSTTSAATQTPSQSNMPNDTQTATSTRPQITAQTEGVVGISDLKLTSSSPTANQGSLLSSEKNNVKLESGTLMLLRVN